MLDGAPVGGITTALAARSRVRVVPSGLKAVEGSFQGIEASSARGFFSSRTRRAQMLDADPRNAEVIKPYLNGKDLNSRPDGSPCRCIVDFVVRPMELAKRIPSIRAVERKVKPDAWKPNRARHRRALVAIRTPPSRIVPSPRAGLTGASRSDAWARLCCQCSCHVAWSCAAGWAYLPTTARHFGLLSSGVPLVVGGHPRVDDSERRTVLSDRLLETFAQPEPTEAIAETGGALHAHRRALMLERRRD